MRRQVKATHTQSVNSAGNVKHLENKRATQSTASTLRRGVEALDQLGRILAEEALAVHDANVGVTVAVQDVGRLAHERRESICRHRTQVGVVEQGEELG